MKTGLAALVLLALTGIMLPDAARAQARPDTDNGRYTLSPIPGGVVRLDSRTGIVTTCRDGGGGWACAVTPDERAAYDAEIGRLLQENAALKADLQRAISAGKTDGAVPKEEAQKPQAEAGRKLEIPLPSDRDVDRMMGFVESA